MFPWSKRKKYYLHFPKRKISHNIPSIGTNRRNKPSPISDHAYYFLEEVSTFKVKSTLPTYTNINVYLSLLLQCIMGPCSEHAILCNKILKWNASRKSMRNKYSFKLIFDSFVLRLNNTIFNLLERYQPTFLKTCSND